MYPSEYTWISEPTNVTSMTNATDSGSTSIPALSWKEPAGIQSHMVNCIDRSSDGSPSIWRKMTRPTTKLAHDIATAR